MSLRCTSQCKRQMVCPGPYSVAICSILSTAGGTLHPTHQCSAPHPPRWPVTVFENWHLSIAWRNYQKVPSLAKCIQVAHSCAPLSKVTWCSRYLHWSWWRWCLCSRLVRPSNTIILALEMYGEVNTRTWSRSRAFSGLMIITTLPFPPNAARPSKIRLFP